MAEVISTLVAILNQECIPLAEHEITACAKLHFPEVCGPSVLPPEEADLRLAFHLIFSE